MDKPWQVIADLELHNLRTNKEEIILAQAEAEHMEFFRGCRAALDPMITYGIRQVPESTRDGPVDAINARSRRRAESRSGRDAAIKTNRFT